MHAYYFRKTRSNIIFDIYGYKNREPVWAEDFYKVIVNSKMALNLTRGKPLKYLTSNRIASLVANGIMTFIDKKTNGTNIKPGNSGSTCNIIRNAVR